MLNLLGHDGGGKAPNELSYSPMLTTSKIKLASELVPADLALFEIQCFAANVNCV